MAVLADLYHMGQNGEDLGDIVRLGGSVIHTHIGRPGSRKYPLPDDGYDYRPFFKALAAAGYEGGVSVEAGFIRGQEDIIPSAAYLRGLMG